MMSKPTVFLGFIVSSSSPNELNVLDGFLEVQNGKITKCGNHSQFLTEYNTARLKEVDVIEISKGHFLMPGLVDCHTHAPQFPNIGLGLDRPLLEWLDKYTFPLEKKYDDEDFARKVYDQVVRRLIKNGTTTACYFGSLSYKGTLQLVNAVLKHKQRALIGKVSMNVKNDAGYYNSVEKEVEETEQFVEKVLRLKSDLIEPVVTPRFAVSCDSELMTALAGIAAKYNCRIQSHISENTGEIQYVLDHFPDSKSYSEVYDKNKILNKKCIMAHAVYLSSAEMSLLSSRGVSVAHCPASNTRLMSGLCPVRLILDHGVTVGLGTDVSGGDSATVLDAMRRAMDVSAHLHLKGESPRPLLWKEAFYLATLGGARALNLEDKIGTFEVGKDFDALLVNVYAQDGGIDQYDYSVDDTEQQVIESLLQRFIYLGDDRNVQRVYVKGVQVK